MPGIEECLSDAMTLPGARGAAIVDWSSGLALGTAGDAPGGEHEVTAVEAAELARLATEQTAFRPPVEAAAEVRCASPFVEDVIVTTRTDFHVLRFIETSFDGSVFLHLWLDRHEGNLALARLRLRSLATELVLV
ncbi:hypothetical protein [Streptomyces sp. RPT161]|uniref:hypothetical protein n=1 Tax=Streptomyces sp. RPT161 TaxID=3015993 RepID=UPI0022B85801|nr:hypothetical protein [Streptomyces sp. RPT161]